MFAVLYHHAAMSTWGKAACWKLHTLACTGHRTTPDREQLLSRSLQLISTYKRQWILPLILFLSKQPHLIPPFNDKRDLENRTWMQFLPCIPLCAQLPKYTLRHFTLHEGQEDVPCGSCSPDLCVSSAKDVTELQSTARCVLAARWEQLLSCTQPHSSSHSPGRLHQAKHRRGSPGVGATALSARALCRRMSLVLPRRW